MTIKVAEQVFSGHPDRLADRIADKVRDMCLEIDYDAKCGIEVLLTGDKVIIAGEVSVQPCPMAVTKAIQRILGTDDLYVMNLLRKQTPELSKLAESGSGDQAIVIGHAMRGLCPQTEANKLVKALEKAGYGPDGKVLMTFRNDELIDVTVSTQGRLKLPVKRLIRQMYPKCTPKIQVNLFKVGGLAADTGVSGRKLVADAYGPHVPHGGGSTHGKDQSKPDYGAWQLAKELAEKELADNPDAHSCQTILVFTPGQEKYKLYTRINKES